ncbi:MAG: dTDP-4-dehydrorhamnose 3,5-epimerase [Candidatus Omnitrophica bacterium]|nr:dTDP-4-dehydrorhamnose 3,5-epimerase [Candidatus Omnitrophota bacterium]
MAFVFEKTGIPEVIVVTLQQFMDSRGFFSELYRISDFKAAGIEVGLAQLNQSFSRKNVLRGMHYQIRPKPQAKVIFVPQGEIFDVAVDIRQGSPTYGKWVGQNLSQDNKRMLFIPAGFAHGFCVLSEAAQIIYMCSDEYAPECERSIFWNDPVVNVVWPIAEPILSSKDAQAPRLADSENNFVYSGK